MHLGLKLAYDGKDVGAAVALAERAERAGLDSVWTAEAYGADAVTMLSFIAGRTSRIGLGTGILQMPARTPANTAMTAMSLDALSGGRFTLGLGASGPQVVEGWHGVAYGKPLQRSREYLGIVRQILARDQPVAHDGETYQIPYDGAGATGLGKALRSSMPALRPELPIYLAAIGPRNVSLAAEIADGWLPTFYSPDHPEVFAGSLDAGFERGNRIREQFTILPTAYVRVGSRSEECCDALRPYFSLYIGGMGARGQNFYFDLICRYGYEDIAVKIQDLYLDGHVREATAAVPDRLIDEMCLVGPLGRIAERLQAWRQSGVDGILLRTEQPETFEQLRKLA
jgi:F420-dependent oxidoreductase-like protein